MLHAKHTCTETFFSVDQHIYALSSINISNIINIKLSTIYICKIGLTPKFSSLFPNFHFFQKHCC